MNKTEYNIECVNISYLPPVFDMIINIVWSEGGDGDAAIVSDDYVDLAEKFDKWRKNRDIAKDYFRIDEEDSINFTDKSNENIVFCKSTDNIPEWVYVFKLKKVNV